MSYRTLLVIKAAVCLIFGIILLAVPSKLYGILGASLGTAGMFAGREYGSALIGAFLLNWYAKAVRAPDAKGAILLYLLVYDAIAMIVTFQAVISGVLNVLGWGIVAVYAFFAVASGIVLARERPFRRVSVEGAV